MSQPRYDWWGYCKGMVRRYPALAVEREARKDGGLTADYSGAPRSRGQGSSTEAAALRALPPVKEREYQAVREAVAATMRRWNGPERLRLLGLVFWEKTHTLEGAAAACHVSYRTARRWHSEFLMLVAKNFGVAD